MALCLLLAQDLIDRAASPETPPAPEVQHEAASTRVPFPNDLDGASLHLEDFLAPLIEEDSEIIRTLLGEPAQELARHALTLLCQVSPTMCNVFKHLRANANAAKEGIQSTLRALERNVPGFEGIVRSEIIRGCVREELDKGTAPNRALKKCYARDKIKDAYGKWVDTLDLSKELARWLKLDSTQQRKLREMLRPVRISSQGIEFQDNPSTLQKKFRKRVETWKGWFREAIHDPRHTSRDVLVEMAGLGLRAEDVARMASLSDWMQERYLTSISTTVALSEIEEEFAEVDGWLVRVDRTVGIREYVKGPTRQLQTEMRTDIEFIRRQSEASMRLHQAVTDMREDIDRELNRRLAARMEEVILRAKASQVARDGRPWGAVSK